MDQYSPGMYAKLNQYSKVVDVARAQREHADSLATGGAGLMAKLRRYTTQQCHANQTLVHVVSLLEEEKMANECPKTARHRNLSCTPHAMSCQMLQHASSSISLGIVLAMMTLPRLCCATSP